MSKGDIREDIMANTLLPLFEKWKQDGRPTREYKPTYRVAGTVETPLGTALRMVPVSREA